MNPRAVWSSFKQQLIQFMSDPQWVIPSIVAPFLFTAVMLMMYPEKSDNIILMAILGGGVLGMWGNTLFASGFTLSYDRMSGTLDSILMSPSDLFDVILGRSLWNTFIGLVNMMLVYVFTEFMFNSVISIAEPFAFALILCTTLLSLASIGLLFASAFVLTRRGYVLTSILEYPIYVLSGAIVPITLLPEWFQPVSMALAPTWGVEALRASAIIGYETAFGFGMVGNALMCVLLLCVYTLAGWLLMRRIVGNVIGTGSFTRY